MYSQFTSSTGQEKHREGREQKCEKKKKKSGGQTQLLWDSLLRVTFSGARGQYLIWVLAHTINRYFSGQLGLTRQAEKGLDKRLFLCNGMFGPVDLGKKPNFFNMAFFFYRDYLTGNSACIIFTTWACDTAFCSGNV